MDVSGALRVSQVPVSEFDALLGLVPWGFTVTVTSTLSLEFGRKVVVPVYGDTWERGEWRLWFEGCSWRVEESGRVLLASGDPPKVSSRALARVAWGPLVGVSVEPLTLDLRLSFDDDIAIAGFTNHRYRTPQWALFSAGADTVFAKAGGVLGREHPAFPVAALPPDTAGPSQDRPTQIPHRKRRNGGTAS